MTPALAIIGAGPSGLVLARLLEVNNIDYAVFDRDASSNAVGQGGTLDVRQGSGQLALGKCGLFEKFQAQARYDGQAFKAVDRSGNIIWDKRSDGRSDMPEIDRKALRQLLLDSVPPEKIHWGARVESINREADGLMTIRFDDNSVRRGFKLVVGADGAWSKTRNLSTSAKPRYSGISYLNTTISTSNSLYSTAAARIGLGSFMALSSGKAIIAQRMGNGSYNVYAGLRMSEYWSKANAELIRSPDFRERLVEEYFPDWSTDITDLIRHSDGSFHTWPLYTLSADSLSWESRPGVTLVGDAAHLALPNGEGVNCAMYDSLQLAQEILHCGLDNLNEAVKRYEEKMLPRGVDHIKDGEEMTTMFYEQDSPKSFKAWLASMGEAS